MGKAFDKIIYNSAQCKKELRALGKLLHAKADLSERDDIQPFFKARRQISAFLGTFAPDIGPATQIAYEYSFLGDFAADLVVGNRKNKQFLAVEFEDGRKNSIFKKVNGRSTTDWSQRLEHGFSQMIDWFFTLDDYKKTHKFEKEFGDGHITFTGLLVVGRSSGVSDSDRRRLHWRRDKVLVDSHPITCITFDDLHAFLENRLQFYPAESMGGNEP